MRRPILNAIEERRKRIRKKKKYLYNLMKDRQMNKYQNRNEALKIIKEIAYDENKLEIEVSGANQNEPFGWPPGTVRGIITICVTLTFLIILMWDFIRGVGLIPINWFLGIVGAVILSYFYSRYKSMM